MFSRPSNSGRILSGICPAALSHELDPAVAGPEVGPGPRTHLSANPLRSPHHACTDCYGALLYRGLQLVAAAAPAPRGLVARLSAPGSLWADAAQPVAGVALLLEDESAPVSGAQPSRLYTVDILTTACPGEPHGMILRTLEAMQKITYPHTSYLCDEGDNPVLKAACERLGVIHVTRTEKKHAKAGNINNALKQATGEIAIILDPDHEPAPFFIDRIIGYFEDPKVGFVQSIQAYRNQDSSIIADAAAQMQYNFYGPIQNANDQALGLFTPNLKANQFERVLVCN